MAKKKKESRFAGKAASSMKSQNSHSEFDYLKKDGLKLYAPEPGETEYFDIVPYIVTDSKHPDKAAEKGEQWFKRPFKTHKNVGANNVTVVCLQSFGERCPICEYRAKRAKEGADKSELSELNTSGRTLWALRPVPTPGKKSKKGIDQDIHVMDISDFCFQKPLTAEIEENEEYEGFADLEVGFTIKCRWNEETFNGNKFAKAGRIDFIEREEELSEDLLEEVPSLDKLLIKMSYDELQAKFFETDAADSDDEDDEEEEEEKPRKKFESSKKKSAKVEDDDDDDDEHVPKRKVKPTPPPPPAKKTKKPEPEPEPEDDDDDEEEEEAELEDQIKDADDIDDLMEIAKDNSEFKKHLKTLKTITKLKLLKTEMLAILNPADDEEEEEEPAPKRKAVPEQKKSAADPKKMTCPSDHEFGVDTEEYNECDDCKLWEKCIEAKEAKAKKK